MIIGIFLKNVRIYGSLTYIPLFKRDNFCGIVGVNGVGKSTLLEALNAYFNNEVYVGNSTSKAISEVVPIIAIPKNCISDENRHYAEILDGYVRGITEAPSINYRKVVQTYIKHRDSISLPEGSYILPIGSINDRSVVISPFNDVNFSRKFHNDSSLTAPLSRDDLQTFSGLYEDILEYIDYIYIPKEIDLSTFTKIDSSLIQKLMGKTIEQMLDPIVGNSQISKINRELKRLFEEISDKLEDFTYKKPSNRQNTLRKNVVHAAILQAFVSLRELHTREGDLPISELSSGEKQRALIQLILKFSSNYHPDQSRLIIAIDEPDSSLHASACYEQFHGLYALSRRCKQLLFASHWYGFLPAVESGSLVLLKKSFETELFDMACFREEISGARGKPNPNALPFEIGLKGLTDFVSAIASTVVGESPYNWIICEGSTEKMYLSCYMNDLITNDRLRIVPVGGHKVVNRIYNYFVAMQDDLKSIVSGRVLFLIDTDAETINVTSSMVNQNMLFRRLLKSDVDGKVTLIPADSNKWAPITSVENALEGNRFLRSLKKIAEETDSNNARIVANFMENTSGCSQESAFSLDLRESERAAMTDFLKAEGVKFKVSKAYAEGAMEFEPEWITGVKSWVAGKGGI